jgi:RNA polymerase sigma factor (TIGR02999 family)
MTETTIRLPNLREADPRIGLHCLPRNLAQNTVMSESKKNEAEEPVAPPEEKRSFDDLFSLLYEELKRIAASVRRAESHNTVNTTALVNEAWLRMKDSPQLDRMSHEHFKATAARVMRHVLVDAARARKSKKRDGLRVPLDESSKAVVALYAEVLAAHEALDRLAEMDARQAGVAELRIFSDLTNPEIAAELRLSLSVVERDWRAAKAWLKKELSPKE